MMKHLLLIFMGAMLFFGGCSIKSSPPVDEYTIVLEQNQTRHYDRVQKCKAKSLKLLEPFGAYAYTTNDLLYVVLPNEENKYNLSAWSEPLATTLYTKTLNALSKSGLFGSVSNYSSVAKGDYILEMEINDFKQYFSHDLKRSYVCLLLHI